MGISLRRLAGLCGLLFGLISGVADPAFAQSSLTIAQQIEAETGGRVGFAALDAGSGARLQWRGGERFAMMSTFKPLACAAYLDLQRRMGGEEQTHRLQATELVTYSPAMQDRVGELISGHEACAESLRLSDNTAANLVLDMIGGPLGLTAFLRDQGDTQTRLDRYETDLNSARPGDVRDTTTPTSMLETYASVLLGEGLSIDSQDQLIAWMEGNEVSQRLLRDDSPADWRIADRSGAGEYGSRAYIALIRFEDRAPVLITAFLTETELSLVERDAALRPLIQAALGELGL
ncbi:MAG: class A beta-lactamase [Alphaproteobacteria bacterium]|nr:class A beta-lactamase [Alphaproteobacteria bacterium]